MTTKAALRELNNAVIDLQAADYNTYARPLKRLAATLTSDDLEPFTHKLKERVDFDAFLASASRGGMVGSDSLNWPTDREEELGLAIILIERGAESPEWFLGLAHRFYYGGKKFIESIRKITTSVIIPFARDFATYVEQSLPTAGHSPPEPTDVHRVFIVHGHDGAPREAVARFITKIGLEPVILHEQASRGMTIVEKLEANGNVGYAVVLLTPDDRGRGKSEEEEKPRARQNVILELGYFLGRLGRERVMAILQGDVEIPSDYMGVVYTRFHDGGAWRESLVRELQSAGYEIDWNRVMR